MHAARHGAKLHARCTHELLYVTAGSMMPQEQRAVLSVTTVQFKQF